MNLLIKNYTRDLIKQIINVQKEYQKSSPNYVIRGEEIYTHYPVFENGKNILCAFDDEGNVLAYAPIAPAPVRDDATQDIPHQIWIDMIYNPYIDNMNLVKDKLLESVMKKVNEIKDKLSNRKIRLMIQKDAMNQDDIAYFIHKGFRHEQSAYYMQRDLTKPIEDITLQNDITIKRWKFDTLDDKMNYLKADHICFPYHPMTYENLEWNINNLWKNGTGIGAFNHKHQLVGNVMVFWHNDEVAETEHVFVLPAYRKKGIAQAILNEALKFLKENGKKKSQLEVMAINEDALKLYKKIGYVVSVEECFLGRYL